MSSVANPANKEERIGYLDNLKSTLTLLVLLHHVSGMFAGSGWYWTISIGNYHQFFNQIGGPFMMMNQAYFISLFFFISAYFTPSSFDRKTKWPFLMGKFWRLGWPFLVYLFIAGPCLNLVIQVIADGNASEFSYAPDAGPVWFVAWLLILNMAYCLFGDPGWTMPFPRMSTLVLLGVFLGLVNVALMSTGMTNFMFMPISFGSLPFVILNFTGGILAKRNNWLDIIHNLEHGKILFVRLFTVGFALVLYAFGFFCFVEERKEFDFWIPTNEGDDGNHDDEEEADLSISTVDIILFIILNMLFGIFCFTCSITAIHLFSKNLNSTGPYSKYFSEAAYTVYLIHGWTITLVGWSWFLILGAMGDEVHWRSNSRHSNSEIKSTWSEINWRANSRASSTEIESTWLIFSGFVYTAVLSNLVTWPIAHEIRKLPVLKTML